MAGNSGHFRTVLQERESLAARILFDVFEASTPRGNLTGCLFVKDGAWKNAGSHTREGRIDSKCLVVACNFSLWRLVPSQVQDTTGFGLRAGIEKIRRTGT